ncbi:MAG: hypothetical protein ABL883_13655 [Terricaulis sp.]
MRAWKAQIVALLAALALTTWPAAAQVPDPFARELAQKLARAEADLSDGLFVRGAGPFAGAMDARGTMSIPLTLRAGEIYRIVGVCDAGCGALELTLANADGARIAHAAPAAGAAAMDVRVPFTGAYEVEVSTPRCTGTECWYAVNVYSR